MLKRLLSALVVLFLLSACDANVRSETDYRAFLSSDGDRIAVVHDSYESFTNVITQWRPGRRDQHFDVYTTATPTPGISGTASVTGASVGASGTFSFDGRVGDLSYIHNAARRYMVADLIDDDQNRRVAVLRIDSAGRPSGGWVTLNTGRLETLSPTADGSLIAVTTRRFIGDADSSFLTTFYSGDTFAEVGSYESQSGFESNNYGSTLHNSLWLKAPRGSDTDALTRDLLPHADYSAALDRVDPVSPLWPARQAAVLAAAESQRTMTDFEWSFATWADAWANPSARPAGLVTFRADGTLQSHPLSSALLEPHPVALNDHRIYLASLGGQEVSLSEGQEDTFIVFASIPVLDTYLDWETSKLRAESRVEFGPGYPYIIKFHIHMVDRSAQKVRGTVMTNQDPYNSVVPFDRDVYKALELHWTRDTSSHLRTCLLHGATESALGAAVVNKSDFESGCDGAPWVDRTLVVGQDCNGVWGGYNTRDCAQDCHGVYNGSATLDGCGVCDSTPENDNTTCAADCAGVFGGSATLSGGTCVLPAHMAVIPAGAFLSGEPEDQRRYTLPGFYMDVHEVTAGEYEACVAAGACTYNGPRSADDEDYTWTYPDRTYQNGRPNHPINFVTWTDASDYCRWAGKRLPTFLEWEKAARGTEGNLYPWGTEEPTCSVAAIYEYDDEQAEDGAGCGTGGTFAVGSKPAGASPYGIQDMVGNVEEWTTSYRIKENLDQVTPWMGYEDSGSFFPSTRSKNLYSIAANLGFRCVQ